MQSPRVRFILSTAPTPRSAISSFSTLPFFRFLQRKLQWTLVIHKVPNLTINRSSKFLFWSFVCLFPFNFLVCWQKEWWGLHLSKHKRGLIIFLQQLIYNQPQTKGNNFCPVLLLLQPISKHSSELFCSKCRKSKHISTRTNWFSWIEESKPTITFRGCRAITQVREKIYEDKLSAVTKSVWEFIECNMLHQYDLYF